jgi:hypothetical protein
LSDLAIFPDFEQDDSSRRLYDLWNFPKATNEVRHFGNIPPEIIDNLLFAYTEPFDVVFDPFGGGGSTIDVCTKRKRRASASARLGASNRVRRPALTLRTKVPPSLIS